MPKGFTTLPDGRSVRNQSAEAREYRASRDAKIKSVVSDVDGEPATIQFTPPPPSIGSPKDAPLPKKGTKKEEKADEIEDLKQLVGAVFASVSALAGSPVYRFSEQECEQVAKPLSRILARHSTIRKVVSTVADPVALVAAVIFPLGVKMSLHASEKREARGSINPQAVAPVTDVRTMRTETPPPAPPQNGHIQFNTVLDRISEGS
jgi:hypothetical protein